MADRAYYEKKYRQAEKEVDACLRKLGRTMTSLRLWQRRERYYAEQMGLDDETRAALLRDRKARAKKKPGFGKRKIKIGGGE